MITGIHLDYKELRGISPKAARRAILQVLKSVDGNVAECARLLHTTRRTIYKALKKDEAGDLDDSSTAPKTVPNRTASDIEDYIWKWYPILIGVASIEDQQTKLAIT